MTTPALEIQHLTKVYERTTALDGVSCQVAAGEIVGLLGPNGAGKTTLLHCLLGLLTPTSGTLTIFGRSMATDRWAILSRLNFAAADSDLPSNLTVAEILDLYARLYTVPRRRAVVAELMERAAIAPLSRRLFGQLSAGERMRVKLAKALLNQPDLLLLDEPTLSLDPFMADQMRQWLLEVHRQRLRQVESAGPRASAQRPMTIVITSHNMAEVERFCERVLFLHRGRLLADGRPADVLQRFGQPNLEALFLSVARGGELVDVEGGR